MLLNDVTSLMSNALTYGHLGLACWRRGVVLVVAIADDVVDAQRHKSSRLRVYLGGTAHRPLLFLVELDLKMKYPKVKGYSHPRKQPSKVSKMLTHALRKRFPVFMKDFHFVTCFYQKKKMKNQENKNLCFVDLRCFDNFRMGVCYFKNFTK